MTKAIFIHVQYIDQLSVISRNYKVNTKLALQIIKKNLVKNK